MSYEINGSVVMNVEEVTTHNQTAIVKTYYDQLYHLEVSTDKNTITADGADTATITASIKDYLNNPVTDQTPVITFEVDGVTQSIQSVGGQAVTTITAATVGDITITASVTDYRGGEVTVHAK